MHLFSKKTYSFILNKITRQNNNNRLAPEKGDFPKAFMDAIPEIIMELDKNKVFTRVNKAGTDFFGEDVIGRNISFYFSEEQDPLLALNRLFKGDQSPLNIKSWHKRNDGSKRLLSWCFKPINDPQGNINCILSFAQDITSIDATQEELRKSEEKFRWITSNTPDHIIINDLDLKYEMVVNPQLGLTESEMLGRTDLELLRPEEAIRLMDIKNNVIQSGKPYFLETSLHNLKGETEFFSGSLVPKLNKKGQTEGIIGYFRNITEKKKYEQALKESEERLRILSLLAPVGIYMTDPEGNCTYTNRKWNEMAGMNEAEALGKGWINGLHPDDKELVFASWQKMIDSQGTWGIEYRFITPENQIKWVHGLAVPQLDQEGRIINYIGVNIDITSQREAENALRESEEKYKSLVDMSPDAIVIHSEGKIVFVNKTCLEMVGVESEAELIGMPAINFVHPEYRELAIQRIKDIYTNSVKAELAYEKFIKPDGEVIDVETTAIPFEFEGKPSIQLIIRDVSKRMKMEEAKIESEIKYHILFESANDALFLMDQEYFIECNSKTLEMFGCKRDQIIGQPAYRFSPEIQPDGTNSKEKVHHKISEALNGKELSFEWKHIRLDGSEFDAEIKLNKITLNEKALIQASVREITQRKVIEAELRKSEAQYRLLADNMNDLVWLMDLSLNTIYISPSVEKLQGFTLQENQQIPIKQRITPESYRNLIEFYNAEKPKIFSNPEYSYNNTIDLEFYNKSGGSFWLEIVFSIIHDDLGDPVSVLCVGRDVTIHKKMSEKLKESEEKLNLFFTQSLDGFFIMEIDEPVSWNEFTDKETALDFIMNHQKVVKANKAMLDQYLATEDQIIGKSLADFFSHDPDQGRKVVPAILDKGHLHVDTLERTTEGSEIVIEGDYICMYDKENRITGLFGIQRDVTAIRKAELALQAQLDELRRWQMVTLGREDRNMEIKREVNELLLRLGEPIRYQSQQIFTPET